MMHYSTTSLHCKNVPTAPPLSTFSLYSSSSSLSPSSSSSSPLPQHHLTSSFHVSRQSYPRAHPSPKQGMKVLCSKSEPIKVMISGAPASGKGTQCEMIVQKFGLVHISTGDLLRAEVSAGTEIGNKAKEYMNAGSLVPDEVVTAMVTARLSQQDAKEKGWLLDGFPRSFAQAQSLEKLNIRPDIYIVLDVRSRLQIYKQNAEAILSTYMDTLNKIDGNRPKEVIFKDVDSLLSQVQKEKVKTTKPVKSTLQSKNQASSSQEIWRGIPTRLNNIPHSRDIRKYFYDDVLQGTKRAIEDGKTRLKVEISIPELNPEMDVYRIGTLMELVRVLALNFADDGKRIKVCVQGSMGEGALAGMPLQLAGSRKILEYMDWGDYGAMGTFINIGSIGGKEVSEEDDMFILVAPQNAVGNCIIDDLRAMTDAAGSRPVILVNPRLKDLPASSGIMQTIGRDKRLEYAASFENCYHFRLLYYAGTQYPIMGALRMSYPYGYELYKRVDDPSFGKEKYNILTTFPKRPNVDEINDTFEGKPRNQDKKASGFWGFLTGVFST
ncbi:adenylate kinase 5, chloroplastic isoform X6 [Rhododendron vialii]|uniref:adenylate kinase 5, chloroplastic isoform X6 n=1 Tax=Rhododendron vialii TaxID=182163 RepID=UPI00265EBB2D|nr:adenylate kinase 5, chloroplastic isoform X6 [Rhododendron vialii]